jgi:hypothetical protein
MFMLINGAVHLDGLYNRYVQMQHKNVINIINIIDKFVFYFIN